MLSTQMSKKDMKIKEEKARKKQMMLQKKEQKAMKQQVNLLIDIDQGVDQNDEDLDDEALKEKKRLEEAAHGHLNEWDRIDENVQAKYEMVQKMGKGNYGTVWKAINKLNRERIAIKKINNAFVNKIDALRTLREIQIMYEMEKHPNIVGLHTVRVGKNNRDVYLVFDLAEADLHTAIRSGLCNNEQKVYLMYQLARALKYMHTGNIIHRDLKPSNILLNQDCSLKLADFGISKVLKPKERQMMTDYVATRWYRPPEVLLGSPIYGKEVDIWGFGCVLVELYIQKPLFPGQSTLNQLSKIIEVTGLPTEYDLAELESPLTFGMFQSMYIPEHHRSIQDILGFTNDQNLIHLVKGMLTFNPQQRLNIEQILLHPYFKAYHNPLKEPKCGKRITPDQHFSTIIEIREFMYELINEIHDKYRKNRPRNNYYDKYTNYN